MAKRRKDPYYHRGEPSRWTKALKVLGVILIMVVVLGFGWALTLMQPKRVTWDDPGLQSSGEVDKQFAAQLDQSTKLEKQFNDAARQREITPDDLITLRQAIELQREYLYNTHNHNLAVGNERLDRMTASLQSYEAKPLRDQSTLLEAQGTVLETSKDLDSAKKLFSQAADLEDKIMHDDLKGKYYDTATRRSITLHRHVLDLAAQPLDDESRSAEITARAALERKDWATALDNFKRAYDLQARLNREFNGLSYTNVGRLQSLTREMTALRSLPEYQKITKQLASAQAADTSGDFLKAAELYQDTERQQRDLNRNFPDSRFADPAAVETTEALRQTALSHSLATEILTQAATLFDDLRHRRIPAAQAGITVLAQKTGRFHDTYPHSTLIGDELQKCIDYLGFKHDDLGKIQDLAYPLLLAVPGQARFQMAKEEVPQALYALVVGGNPSRNQGPQLPVDSVSWIEAKSFCQRLSWLLARPVRLPTAEEFHAALGPADAVNLATTWNYDNANGKTQLVASKAANAAGFYDLLGNVAEWLEHPLGLDADVAPVIGGNVQTRVDAIRAVPSANLDMTGGNAYTGFRFVVDSDDSAPVLPGVPAPKAN